MLSPVVFSRKSDHWATPPEFRADLDAEFGFTFDPCPLHSEVDGLTVPWGRRVFCNPPYSNIRAFLERGLSEMARGAVELVVYLIPARTDTRWFHDLILGKAEVRFIKGRLKFGGAKTNAPFPSMVVIYRAPS